MTRASDRKGRAGRAGGRDREGAARALRVGCREGNIEILRMLPTSVPDVMKRLRVTKMPANRRVNDLMDVGLLERELGTGRLMPTPMTSEVLRSVDAVARKRGRDHA